ncbi:MAG: hypothetical protein QOI24_1552 [Acidobacteriota bacterium]|jgi:hypothetical protein|nr:hypothetical protein [Acidobacteriota bacterium]
MSEFRFKSRRFARAKRVQTVQHLTGALMLISAAIAHLSDAGEHHSIVLPTLELLAGGLLVGSVVAEKLHHRKGTTSHSAIGWVEIAGAVMAFVEAISRLQQRHHFAFYVLSFIAPLMLLLFGIFDLRLRTFRNFVANDEGIVRRSHLIHLAVPKRYRWDSMKSFRVLPASIEVTERDGGTTTITLRDVVERDEAVAWFRDELTRRGIVES